jgi:type II secretion system protein J
MRPISFRIHGWARRAFTLLEVMIAMAILTVVVAAIYGTLHAIMGAMRVSQIVATQVQQERMALRWIDQALTCAIRHEASLTNYYFLTPNEERNTLSFVARLPESFPRSGRFGYAPVRRLEFTLQRAEEGGNDLVLRQRLLMVDEFDVDEREHPLVLMHHVKEMTTEYWDMQQQEWTDDWTSSNQIPAKLKVTLSLENTKNSYEPNRELVQEVVPESVGVPAILQGQGFAAGGAPAGAPGLPGQPGAPGLAPPPTRR